MPDSFFTSGKQRKRKRTESTSVSGPSQGKKTRYTPNVASRGKKSKGKRLDEDLDSNQTSDAGDADDLRVPSDLEDVLEEENDPDETPAEKRLRLAQLYLDGVKEDIAANQGDFDAAEIDNDLISSRLRGAQYKGRVHLFVADEFAEASSSQLKMKGHRFSCTAAVASPVTSSSTTPGYYLFTAGKEGHIMKWDLQNGRKVGVIYQVKPDKGKGKGKGRTNTTGHTSSVTSLALTTDGTYLASGSMDSRTCVWDARSCRWITSFTHKDIISSLSFRTNTNSAAASSSAHILYTASFDRTVKLWTLPSATPLSSVTSDSTTTSQTPPQNTGYIETLFGHQDQILALDCLPSLPILPTISSTSVVRRKPSASTMTNPSRVPVSAASKTFAYSRHPLITPAETLLTVGGRDKTARFWKVPEETQLVFRGGGATSEVHGRKFQTKRDKLRDVLEGKLDALATDDEDSDDDEQRRKKNGSEGHQEHHRYIEGSLESVAMIDENTFLTGGDSGSICLWSTARKKPVFTCGIAHGVHDPLLEQVEDEDTEKVAKEEVEIAPHPRWITALASLRYSDLFASGSYDGNIRLWKLSSSSKKNEGQLSTFTLLCTIPCAGVINSLQFVTPEESFWTGAHWAFSDAKRVNNTKLRGYSVDDHNPRKLNPDARPILLIASIGQEHRFGRWVSVKHQIIEHLSVGDDLEGEGDDTLWNGRFMKQVPVRNGASVWALFPTGWGEGHIV
ncbi:WD40-repeat-containing domain protein [Lentinula aciculospora]|uniref:WD40-repeat-containing domain protein n=1 Tax=Lentinula aciculospora TaxID=153920 RepID=A0A9W9A569_9AGAR|nr:WD40-repeat-containing domain protein [Lentinula aciculospora]